MDPRPSPHSDKNDTYFTCNKCASVFETESRLEAHGRVVTPYTSIPNMSCEMLILYHSVI